MYKFVLCFGNDLAGQPVGYTVVDDRFARHTTGGTPVSDERKPTIADKERSPVSEAADEVPFGPSGTKPEDERESEPAGTADKPRKAEGQEDEPTIPPARSHH